MKLHFKSKWKQGDIHEYKFIKSKSKVKNGVEESKKETIKIVELQVLETNTESDLLKWTVFEDSNSLISRLFLKIFKERLDETFTISYTTSKSGIIDELVDTKDLDFQIRLLKKQLNTIIKTHQEKELIEDVIKEDVIITRLLKSMYILHFPYDEEFSDTPLIEDTEMVNPFMKGNTIPGQIINSIFYLDEINRIGEIQIENKFDQAKLNEVMKETVTEIGIRLEKNRKEEKQEVPIFVATEIYNYKINLDSNLIISGKYEKVFKSKNQENIEQIEFNLIK